MSLSQEQSLDLIHQLVLVIQNQGNTTMVVEEKILLEITAMEAQIMANRSPDIKYLLNLIDQLVDHPRYADIVSILTKLYR